MDGDVAARRVATSLWMRGPDNIRQWMLGVGSVCKGSRLVPTTANGSPAFGHYHAVPDGGHEAWALQVIEISEGKIVALNSFLDTATLFPLFGLPMRLEEGEAPPSAGAEV
jgi:RNA polymerase sigma-70 factor, ECF subfamily